MERLKIIINWKIILIFAISIFGAAAIIYYQYQEHVRLNTLSLTNVSRITQAAINSDRVQSVVNNPSDSNNPDLIRLREQLSFIANSVDYVRYVYLMALGPQGLYFIADSQPKYYNGVATDPSELAEFGEVYTIKDENILDVVYGKKPITISTGQDKWGHFVSSALPIYSKNNDNIIAVIGIDIDQQTWHRSINSGITPTLVFISILFLVEIFLYINYLKTEQNRNYLLYLSSILDSSQDAIISLDLKGVVRSWNQGAETIFGYKKSEIVGKNISLTVPKDKQWEIENCLAQAKIGKGVVIPKTERINKDGSVIIVFLTTSPIINHDGEFVGVSIIAHDDTTEYKHLTELQAKNNQLEKMNKLLVGREIQMVKLKTEINRLRQGVKS